MNEINVKKENKRTEWYAALERPEGRSSLGFKPSPTSRHLITTLVPRPVTTNNIENSSQLNIYNYTAAKWIIIIYNINIQYQSDRNECTYLRLIHSTGQMYMNIGSFKIFEEIMHQTRCSPTTGSPSDDVQNFKSYAI